MGRNHYTHGRADNQTCCCCFARPTSRPNWHAARRTSRRLAAGRELGVDPYHPPHSDPIPNMPLPYTPYHSLGTPPTSTPALLWASSMGGPSPALSGLPHLLCGHRLDPPPWIEGGAGALGAAAGFPYAGLGPFQNTLTASLNNMTHVRWLRPKIATIQLAMAGATIK